MSGSLNPVSAIFSQRSPIPDDRLPGARASAAMWFNSPNNELILFGGVVRVTNTSTLTPSYAGMYRSGRKGV
jgi:hypothetical protein